MTTLQKTLTMAALAAAIVTGMYEARQASRRRKESDSQQQQIAQLKFESESLSNRLTSIADAKSLPNEQFNEMLRLRGQVTALRQVEQENARLKTERDALAKRIEEASAMLPENDPGFQQDGSHFAK